MEDVTAHLLPEEAVRLLSYATSDQQAETAYEQYIASESEHLLGFAADGVVIGCIGVKEINSGEWEIRHIAVAPYARRQGYGKAMIQKVQDKWGPDVLCAETDQEAVGFYQSLGFNVKSSGEKYPGIERFWCCLKK